MEVLLPAKGRRRSPNAAAVARDVIATVRKGKKVVLGKIMKENGYSDWMTTQPGKVTSQPAYKEEMEPIVQAMIAERDAILKLLPTKRGRAAYHQLIEGMDKMTKNIQLLTGGQTENTGLEKHIASLQELFKTIKGKKK